MGRENAHSHRAGHVSVAPWGGRGGRSCIFGISFTGLRRGSFLGEERTGYGSRPRIGSLAVPLLCKEEAGGVGSQTKETGQRTLRRWDRTRRERVRLVGRP